MDAIELLKTDHRKVEQLFQQAMQGSDPQLAERLAGDIDRELTIHAEIEEKIFYPAVRKQNADLIKEGYTEHGEVKLLLNKIAAAQPFTSEGRQLTQQLQQAVQHHVQDEEQKLFPKVQQELGQQQLQQIGLQLQQAKTEAEKVMQSLEQQKLKYTIMSMGQGGMSAQI